MTILYPKWMPIIKAISDIGDPYVAMISKAVDVSYCHVSEMVVELEERGIIKTIQQGNNRRKVVKLTPKGEKIAEAIISLNRHLPMEGRAGKPPKVAILPGAVKDA